MASTPVDEIIEERVELGDDLAREDFVEEQNAEEEVNNCPVEEVRMTVAISDDPSLPTLTFRTWLLGILSCAILAFVNDFFGYRTNGLSVSSVSIQILALPLGKLMAATLPTRIFKLPFTNWSFSLNPGPFNLKEHVLITIFANVGGGGTYAIRAITMVRAFYHRDLNPAAAFLLTLTTQMLGYGWAGLFRTYLVDSSYMWWPVNLVQVSLFRALHEKERRPKGSLSRLQFFLAVSVCSFAYYIIPGYLFPWISAFSITCLLWKNSITAQQIGSGLNGLGIGSFGLDWSTVSGFLSSPLASPGFAIINRLVGFVLTLYILTPIAYWTNAYGAKKFPIVTSHTFDSAGNIFNVSRILNQTTFSINRDAYNRYSELFLSPFFAFNYGLSFATAAATVSHVALFHGKSIWQTWKNTSNTVRDETGDVHTRLMKKNYDVVPQWWFHIILVSMIALAIFACEGFGKQLQLPWWGVLMACGIAFFFTLPIGIIQATTNQQMVLTVISESVIGYLYPGRPLASSAFKIYGYISMSQALTFLSDFKLGHYMKIPPKSMFIVQLVGTIVGSSVYFGTTWWLLGSVDHICEVSKLPKGSPWTCPKDDVFYNSSIIWGVIGPLRVFTSKGVYPEMNWFFLVGSLAPVPVWLLSKKFPNQQWIKQVNIPLILAATSKMPTAKSVHYITWFSIGVFFRFHVYRRHKMWWARHNYLLSAGLDAGLAFMAFLVFFSLESSNINGPDWWGLENNDLCPLATCPTAPGVVAKGCPIQ